MAQTDSRSMAGITAVGHYLPDQRLTNHDLEQLVDTNDEWIRTRTGIKERRLLDPEKPTSFMAAAAAQEALDRRGLSPDDVDVIITATITPDMPFPATSCIVQDRLGARNAWGFDMSAACCGFLFGLTTAVRLVETGQHQRVLVIGADKMSSIIDFTDRSTCILFGDGAAAVLIEPMTDGNGFIDTVHHSDGSGAEKLCMKGGGSMYPASFDTVDKRMHFVEQDGRVVFKRAVESMADVSVEIMQRNGLSADDVRYLVPHQANYRILEATARRMGLPIEKVMINIDRYGNTTAATLPLCLYDYADALQPGDNLILAAFGGGYTWGATYLRWAY